MFRSMTDTRLRLLIAIALAVVTVIAYWPVLGNGFVNYDDDRYVYNNPRVLEGVSVAGIVWAFKSTWNANWHPLTWISHMVDCEIYGTHPMGHHLTNLIFHLANTLLLFLLLIRLTGSTWRSAFVAALFAVHPLHVESVAWVAERKDVLSTFFLMLTLLAYARYVESRNIKRYLLVVGMFALGLMAKPMLVSVPFVLLLLDYWPFRRFSPENASKKKKQAARPSIAGPLLEKLPLLAMALGSSVITLIAQTAGGAMNSLAGTPFGIRLASVTAAYVAYILKMVWPLKLGVIYPHPGTNLPEWQVVGSALFLAAVSYLVYRQRTQRPWLAVGWLWYVVTLIPVIGLVQVGAQFIADRYTYIPLIGLFVGIAWSVGQVGRVRLVGAIAVIVVLACTAGTFRQAGYWKDSRTLFAHTLMVAAPSATAHTNLGIALAEKGDQDAAIRHYEMALEISPDHVNARYNMGNAYVRKKMYDEAIEHYQRAISIRPQTVEAHLNLANAYAEMRLYDSAEAEYKTALEYDPDHFDAITNLAGMYKDTGRFSDAEELYRRALEIRPSDPESHSSLGVALAGQGMLDEAVEHFTEALRLDPRHAGAHVNMANVHAARKDYDKAAEEYQTALEIDPKLVEAHHNLGLVLKSRNDLDGAIFSFRRAVELEPSMPNLHFSLATALYAAGDFAGAWKHVHLCEANGGRPPKHFVDALSAQMPDPRK